MLYQVRLCLTTIPWQSQNVTYQWQTKGTWIFNQLHLSICFSTVLLIGSGWISVWQSCRFTRYLFRPACKVCGQNIQSRDAQLRPKSHSAPPTTQLRETTGWGLLRDNEHLLQLLMCRKMEACSKRKSSQRLNRTRVVNHRTIAFHVDQTPQPLRSERDLTQIWNGFLAHQQMV